MDYVTVNLTPGKSFYNFQAQRVKQILVKTDFTNVIEYSDFYIFKTDKLEKIKIRKDGNLYYSIPINKMDELSFESLLTSINKIIVNLNGIYEGLLDVKKMYIYWPEDYKFKCIHSPKYIVSTNLINDNEYASILNKKSCYNC